MISNNMKTMVFSIIMDTAINLKLVHNFTTLCTVFLTSVTGYTVEITIAENAETGEKVWWFEENFREHLYLVTNEENLGLLLIY